MSSSPSASVSERITLLCEAYGLSIDELASLLGLNPSGSTSDDLAAADYQRLAAHYELPSNFFEMSDGPVIDQLRLLATLRSAPTAALRLRGRSSKPTHSSIA